MQPASSIAWLRWSIFSHNGLCGSVGRSLSIEMLSDLGDHRKEAEDRVEFTILKMFIYLSDWECAVAIIETYSPLVSLFKVRPSAAVRCNNSLTQICAERSSEAGISFLLQLSSNSIDVAIQPFDRRFVVF